MRPYPSGGVLPLILAAQSIDAENRWRLTNHCGRIWPDSNQEIVCKIASRISSSPRYELGSNLQLIFADALTGHGTCRSWPSANGMAMP